MKMYTLDIYCQMLLNVASDLVIQSKPGGPGDLAPWPHTFSSGLNSGMAAATSISSSRPPVKRVGFAGAALRMPTI